MQDKKEKDHFKREEELLERAVQPHNSPLGAAFIPVLLFTRYVRWYCMLCSSTSRNRLTVRCSRSCSASDFLKSVVWQVTIPRRWLLIFGCR